MTQVTDMTFALQESDLLRARATASRFDPHLHSTYSVVVLKSGTAEVRSERWSRTVRSGDVFFFNPYEVHAARCLGAGADYETLYPSRAFIDEVVAPATPGGALQIQTDILSRHSQADALLGALSSAPANSAAVDAALRKVLAACVFTAEPSAMSPMAVARTACLVIRENCMRAMRTQDLARQMGVHKSHLVRAFTSATGLAPQTYIRQVRVARARELICAGSPLSEVAQMLEFCDQAHLTREFKKVFGVPPGALSRDVGKRAGARAIGPRHRPH
jgi:AraC-like DNA-binding protein